MPKKPPAPLKEKSQRVLDAVELLRNLQSVGIPSHDVGYQAIKSILDTWISNGEAWTGNVDLARYGRYADIILPARADRKCTMVLRATEALRKQVNEEES
jgi:hypothetical protein